MAEPIGSLVVRIGGDATDLIDSFRRAGAATENFNKRVEGAVTAVKGLAAALAIREMAEFISGIAEADDRLGKMAEQVGVSVEQLSELKYAAKLSNVSLEQLGTGLQQLSRFMIQNGEAGQSVEERLYRIAEQFSKMPDGAEKTAAAMEYFGRTGAALIPILNQGAAGLRANAEEARKLGLILSDDAAKAAGEFSDNLAKVEEVAIATARDMSGPLVKAIAEAADEFVKAKKAGESFFESMIEGFRTLVTGNDAYKLDKQIVEATNRFLDAQRALDQARDLAMQRGFSKEETDRFTREYVEAVKKAKAEVDKLIAIKPILAPEEQAKPKQTGGGGGGGPVDYKANEAMAKQLQEGVDEEQRIQAEALAATVAFRDAQLAKEKEFQDSRLKAIMDYYDAEQAAAIEQGKILLENDDISHSTRLEMLRAQHDEEYAENERYRLALQDLDQTFTDAELAEIGGRQAIAQKMEEEHQARLRQIRSRGNSDVLKMMKAFRAGDIQDGLAYATTMTANLSTYSRKAFELNKLLATANAVVKGVEAVQSSYAWAAAWGGPPAGAAAAAVAAAFSAAQVAAIQAASFGGGTAPSVAGTTAAPAVSNVAPTQPQAQAPRQNITVSVVGSRFSREDVMDLIQHLNEAFGEGARLNLQTR